MSKERLSTRKSAAYLNIPVSTFAGYVRAGRGPRHIRLHGIRQFETPILDEWAASRTVEGSK